MFDFKGLIGALLRRPPAEGIHNLKSATIWVQELPQGDIHQAQAEIVKTVASLNNNTKISVKERVRTILYLDDKAQSLQYSLCQDYLQDAGFGKHYLPTILAFWAEMANAYKTCLRQYSEKPTRFSAQEIPTVVARGLHYYAMQTKWNHLRYLPVDAKNWRNLHRFYQFAEAEGIADLQVKLYPDSPTYTTCTQQYLQPFMLELASPESLLPAQIDMVDHWLDQWVPLITLDKQIRPHRQLFAINLDESKPARKLRRNMVDTKYRYWGTDTLIEKIEQIAEALKQGELPARLGLGERFRLPAGLDLLETVANRWSREGAGVTRKHERQSLKKNIQVIHGFRETLEQLRSPNRTRRFKSGGHGNTGIEIIAHTLPPAPEGEPELFDNGLREWQMENESQYGIGASFNSDFDDSLAVGDLIGLKPEEQARFAIGIVRRIQKTLEGEVYVGIETINQTPILVKLGTDDTTSDGDIDAIYLPEADNGAIPRCLLIKPDTFEQGKVLHLKAQGKSFTIRLKQPIDVSGDYARTRFAVLAKHESPTAAAAAVAH